MKNEKSDKMKKKTNKWQNQKKIQIRKEWKSEMKKVKRWKKLKCEKM